MQTCKLNFNTFVTHPLPVLLSCSPERKEDVTYAGNYMVFGHGPHYCVGKEYANNHLIAFLAIVATSLDWSRTR
jgi:cytochrome P450